MGAPVLTGRTARWAVAAGLALALAAGGELSGQEGAGNAATDTAGPPPHADLACAACHRGPRADREVGAVPEATCTASGCHEDGGPERIRVSTVEFLHRDHADTARVDLGCAGCHGHETGEAPITPTLASCGLCHADQLGGNDPTECLACHQEPDHVPMTNQGIRVPHAEIPWITEGCVRCHYDVSRPVQQVSIGSCRECHAEVEELAEPGMDESLHPSHAGVGCLTCHAPGTHELVAMSSAVYLRCASCHRGSHEVEVRDVDDPGPAVCVDCHRDTHADQQRLVLGFVDGVPVSPSYKYLSGLACGTCHADAEGGPPASYPLGGRAEACVACHRPEYREVLEWWGDGATQRIRRVRAYLDRARRSLGSADTVEALLERSAGYVELVARAGAQHNLALSDELLRRGVELAEAAYGAAGRRAPVTPELGRRPRVGFCSYCHYRIGEPADFQEMPEDFHLDVEARFEELRERERRRKRGGASPDTLEEAAGR